MPEKEAVSAWVPMPSDTGTVAWPVASTGTKPRTVVPSRKVTEPIGVPARELTVAVSVSICPKTAVAVDVLSVVVVAAAVTGVGGVQQHTDGAGGGVGRDQVHEAVAVQVGRRHAQGVIAAGQEVQPNQRLEGAVPVAGEHGEIARGGPQLIRHGSVQSGRRY